jgi:hypothetical protein
MQDDRLLQPLAEDAPAQVIEWNIRQQREQLGDGAEGYQLPLSHELLGMSDHIITLIAVMMCWLLRGRHAVRQGVAAAE